MGLPYPTRPGDLDRRIADDHTVAERLLQHLEAGRGDRRTLADQLVFNLSLHAAAEEQVLYPALADHGDQRLAGHGRDQHHRIKEALATLDEAEPGSPEFEAALGDLAAEVRRHVVEEESQLLPRLRELLDVEHLAELGEEFAAAKRTAPTRAHPQAPDSPPGNTLLNWTTAALDRTRDLFSGRAARLATDATGLLDEQSQRVLDAYAALRPLPFEALEPDQARRQPTLADAVEEVLKETGLAGTTDTVASVRNHTIEGPGGPLDLRVYLPHRPASGPDPLPVTVYAHPGGGVVGDPDGYEASARAIAAGAGCLVVSVDYRKAPEHPFPAAHDDVLAATGWVLERVGTIGGDPTRVAVVGESFGANLLAAACLGLRDAALPLPACQVLIYPLASAAGDEESWLDSADAHPLNTPTTAWFLHQLCPGGQLVNDPRFDLLATPVDQLRGLPPTLVITAERDPLRSQGERLAELLASAGVRTTLTGYRGVTHEFFGTGAVVDTARCAQQQVCQVLRAAFGTRPAGEGPRTV